jgi:hypothetical protein
MFYLNPADEPLNGWPTDKERDEQFFQDLQDGEEYCESLNQ